MNIESLFKENYTSIVEDNTPTIHKDYFNKNYGYTSTPVVFRNAFQDWKIKEKWELSYLQQVLDHKTQEISENDIKKNYTLSQYITSKHNTSDFYYTTQNHLFSKLIFDYQVPDIFKCWYRNANKRPKVFLSWLYVGKEKTMSDLHQDVWMTSAWNYLISGRKLWVFFPLSYNEMIKKDKEVFSMNQLEKRTFLESWKSVKPLFCIQNPGDLVFTPSKFWHGVYNLERTVSLTENFLNETNYDNVLSFFKKKMNEKTIKSMEDIINQGFKILM